MLANISRPSTPVCWRTVSSVLSRASSASVRSTSAIPVANRFVGRFGPSGPKRILPSSWDDLPEFTSSFPHVFAKYYEGIDIDEQVVALMVALTQLSRFKPDISSATNVSVAAGAMRAEAESAATAAGGGTPPPQASGTLPPVPTVQHYFGGTARIQALEEIILWLCATVSKQVWICVLLVSSIYSFATSTCTTTSVHTTQAILRLSECINAKNTFKLVNKALLTSVATTVQPPSSCPKIIVMKNRVGLHNVCIFSPVCRPHSYPFPQVRLHPSLKTPIVSALIEQNPVAFVVIKDGWAKLHPLHYGDLQVSDTVFRTQSFVHHDPLTQGWCVTQWQGEDVFDVIPSSTPEAMELQERAGQWHAEASAESRLALSLFDEKPPPKPVTVTCKKGHECVPFTYTKQHNCDLRSDPKFSPACLKRFSVGDQGYRCSACDYDVCLACYGASVGPALLEEVESSSDLLTMLVSLVAAVKNQPTDTSSSSFSMIDTHSLFYSVSSAIASGSPRPLDAVKASCSLITSVVPGSSMLSRQALRYLDSAMHPDLLPPAGTCRVVLPDWVIKAAMPQQSALMPLLFAGSPLICMPSFGWADISPLASSTFTFRISIPAACVLAHMRTHSSSATPTASTSESLADSTGLPRDVVITAVNELSTLGVLKMAFADGAGAESAVILANAWSGTSEAASDEFFSASSPLARFASPLGQMTDEFSSAPTPSTSRTAIGFVSSSPYSPPSHPALTSSSSIIRCSTPLRLLGNALFNLALPQRHPRLRVPLVRDATHQR